MESISLILIKLDLFFLSLIKQILQIITLLDLLNLPNLREIFN